MNVGDLRRKSGECQGCSRECSDVGSPKFVKLRQSSHEGARLTEIRAELKVTHLR